MALSSSEPTDAEFERQWREWSISFGADALGREVNRLDKRIALVWWLKGREAEQLKYEARANAERERGGSRD